MEVGTRKGMTVDKGIRSERLNLRITKSTALLLDVLTVYYSKHKTTIIEELLKQHMEEVQEEIIASLIK